MHRAHRRRTGRGIGERLAAGGAEDLERLPARQAERGGSGDGPLDQRAAGQLAALVAFVLALVVQVLGHGAPHSQIAAAIATGGASSSRSLWPHGSRAGAWMTGRCSAE